MDMITLALAKKYTDSQRLAHITPGTKLTFDGNREGLEVLEDDESYVYISTNTYDLNCVESLVLHIGNVSGTVAKGDFYVEGDADAQYLYLTDEEIPDPMVLSIPGMGTAILAIDEIYVSEITFAETIHPIDPKFLPSNIGGSGAFVFDCSAYGIPVDTQTGELTSGTYPITAEQSQAILDAIGNAVPIMIADKVPNAAIAYPCLMGAIQGGITYLMVGLFNAPKAAMIYETSIVVSAME